MYGVKVENNELIVEEGTKEELESKNFKYIWNTEYDRDRCIQTLGNRVMKRKFRSLTLEQLQNPTDEIYHLEKMAFMYEPKYKKGSMIQKQIERLQQEKPLN